MIGKPKPRTPCQQVAGLLCFGSLNLTASRRRQTGSEGAELGVLLFCRGGVSDDVISPLADGGVCISGYGSARWFLCSRGNVWPGMRHADVDPVRRTGMWMWWLFVTVGRVGCLGGVLAC